MSETVQSTQAGPAVTPEGYCRVVNRICIQTAAEADRRANALLDCPGVYGVSTYQCKHCGLWHLRIKID